jgi:DNA-binding HxlR family transcriptional regulator
MTDSRKKVGSPRAAPRGKPRTKLPGTVVRGSRTGRPIMAAFDLLGQRWTLRILWELRQGPIGFRALRDAADALSPTLLNSRLKDLAQARLVSGGHDGYALTLLGRKLLEALAPLHDWAKSWQDALEPE